MTDTTITIEPGDGHTVAFTATEAGGVITIGTVSPAPAPAPLPPVPAQVVRRVAGIHDARPPADTVMRFPGTRLERPFIGGIQTTPRSLVQAAQRLLTPYWNVGLCPQYSLKLDPVQVAAGAWDGPIEELAGWHLAQLPSELVIDHEPENDAHLRGGVFQRYFNHVAGVFRATCTTVPLVYAAMGYQWLVKKDGSSVKGGTDNPADWRVDADVFSIDVYSGNSVPLTTILPEHVGWARWMEYIVQGREWGVSERGFITSTDHTVRAQTIERELEWLLADPDGRRCRRYIYWNTEGTEKNPAIVLDAQYGEPAVKHLIAALAADVR